MDTPREKEAYIRGEKKQVALFYSELLFNYILCRLSFWLLSKQQLPFMMVWERAYQDHELWSNSWVESQF